MTYDTLASWLNQTILATATNTEFTLAELSELRENEGFKSYSILLAAANCSLEQGSYEFALPNGELVEWFVVPVGYLLADKNLLCYECVFNLQA